MGRRSAYSSAPQNVCDAVKRKEIACLPARSHAFNHEAKMLACKGIFARPSMPSPCRRHGWGQSPRRLQSSIRRRQFNHEVKMLACKSIFTRPSIAQTHLWCVEASAVKNCKAILSADIIPRSKNVCSHRHFHEAVNCAAAHSAGAAKPL